MNVFSDSKNGFPKGNVGRYVYLKHDNQNGVIYTHDPQNDNGEYKVHLIDHNFDEIHINMGGEIIERKFPGEKINGIPLVKWMPLNELEIFGFIDEMGDDKQ